MSKFTNEYLNRCKKKPPFWMDFWRHVTVVPSGCWEWKHRKNTRGYGTIKIMNKSILSHRHAWNITNGPIANGMCILHSCDNPACCNPSHLFLGTIADNNADKMAKGRFRANCGELIHTAKLTEATVKKIRSLYSSGRFSHATLAAHIGGISECTIGDILRGKSWKHVK